MLSGLGAVTFARLFYELMLIRSLDFNRAKAMLTISIAATLEYMIKQQSSVAEREVITNGNQLYLVGWSESRGRIDCVTFEQCAGETSFRRIEHSNETASTPHAFGARALDTFDEMEAFANRVVACGLSSHLTGGYGGRLVIAQIERDRIETVMRPVRLPE